MRILLPPSVGKRAPSKGAPVDLSALSFPELTPARNEVLDALEVASKADDAHELLGVGASLAAEVERNTRLRAEPAAPALSVYSGVLYDALGWQRLPAPARRRGRSKLVVVSALWGAVTPADRVPAYRLSMDTDLPGVGPLAKYWRAALREVLTEWAGRHLIVDARSATYGAAWKPTAELAERTVALRVLREQAGRRTVVSHMAKHTRGEVVRHLLSAGGTDPSTPQRLHEAVATAFPAELTPPAKRGAGWTLDVILTGDAGG